MYSVVICKTNSAFIEDKTTSLNTDPVFIKDKLSLLGQAGFSRKKSLVFTLDKVRLETRQTPTLNVKTSGTMRDKFRFFETIFASVRYELNVQRKKWIEANNKIKTLKKIFPLTSHGYI